ncbi:GNAT family N-acetyltransferase [Amycolatopsis coloradensis]|uniref:GNAT family N-acetyltransferase n=1 Tax=Amycolatopsis coloradensis TaxID=76021 RepID=A0A1R0KIW4_9PSEU|nr:GNAT family N-acetyltransferase [Amycolatopsis coloradensis]OLZ45750.1 GNAT family N-acetyltransferase [Amycolatopsis coloradensis]
MEAPAETLTDDVVVLRRWKPEQLGTLAAVAGDSAAHLGAWLSWATGGYGEPEAKEFLEHTARNWAEGTNYDFAIFAGGEVVGGAGMMTRPGWIEIGYWLGRHHIGRGFVTRAARLLTAEAFRLGAPEVEIRHDEKNLASGAVPARLGFTMIGEEAAEPPLAPACAGVSRIWRLKRP